jgi:hypothetical protein
MENTNTQSRGKKQKETEEKLFQFKTEKIYKQRHMSSKKNGRKPEKCERSKFKQRNN